MSVLRHFEGLHHDTFIETGFGRGETIDAAIAHGFRRIISIEIDPIIVDRARRRAWMGEFEVRHGDSAEMLSVVIDPHHDTVFWLDAHWSAGGYGESKPPVECPLLAELAQIVDVPWQAMPTVLIDDAFMFEPNATWRTTAASPYDPDQWPYLDEIADVLAGWRIVREGDILRAVPGT